MKYKLAYTSKETGYKWESEPVFNSKEMAKHTKDVLEKETPYYEIRVVAVKTSEKKP